MSKQAVKITILSILVAGLAAVAVVTALQLRKLGTTPIAPTAQVPSLAAEKVCEVDLTVGATPTPTPTPPASCQETCSSSADCSGSMVCVGNKCVNAACPSDTDCVCSTPTPTPTPSGSPTPTPIPTVPGATPTPAPASVPQLPEAGITLPTWGILGAGGVSLLLGILAILL